MRTPLIGLARVLLAASLVLAPPACALAGPPSDQLKPAIDHVIKVLDETGLNGDGNAKERRDAIRDVTNPLFDWTDMARRSLGRHWQQRTDAERDEFVRLFRVLLERSYITTIERYNGERIVYVGDSVDGDWATVRTKFITRQRREVPIDYRMSRHQDRWLIYDVLVDGVSLVGNYRAQFDQIIQTASYQDLVKRLRAQ